MTAMPANKTRTWFLVATSMLASAAVGFGLAAPAFAEPQTGTGQDKESVQRQCSGKGVYAEHPDGSYSCSYLNGNSYWCTADRKCTYNMTQAGGQRTPDQPPDAPPLPGTLAPDQPVQVTPGPFVKPGAGKTR